MKCDKRILWICSALLAATVQQSHAMPAAFPLERGEVVMTGASALDGFCLRVFDVRSPGAQPFGQNWLAPVFHDSTWTGANLGEVFGVCLDNNDPPNIYVTATSVYGTGSFGPGNTGGVYKINGVTGVVSVFASLPSGPASLGNICFDAAHNQFFVSDLDTGLIYRLNNNGVEQTPAYNHGTDGRLNGHDLNGQSVGLSPIQDDPQKALTPAGRRVWGVQVRDGRLYYSVWNNDRGQPDPATVNEIWSIAIASGDGSFNLTDIRKELSLPRFSINGVQNWSSPVSDISFSGHGKMLLGERSVSTSADRNSYGGDGNSATYAHVSRVLEYEFQASPAAWLNLSGAQYFIGFFSSFSNSAGGVDYDCDDRVFATGDALIHNGTTSVYGLQIIPPGGNTQNSVITTSYLVDLDGSTGYNTDKTQIGDVALYHADCESIACLAITCPTNKTVQCGAPWAFDEPIATDVCTRAILPMSILDTITNNLCPLAISRTWTLTYPAGHTNTCSQTVSVMPPLTFLTPTLDNSLQSTYSSPSGNGSIKVSLSYTPSQSFAQYSTTPFPSTFPMLFPNANNNWVPPAGTYLAGLSFNGPFSITIDLNNYHNLPSRFVFGLYNFRNSGYTLKAYDSTGAQIAFPLPWHLIGNDDDALHPQAATHLGLDLNTGLFSTAPYQTGGQSDAAFWNNIPIDSGNNIPTSTAKIVISGSAGNQNDYIGVYFAEYAPNPPIFNCPPDKTVECSTAWTFDTPTATNTCSGTDATITVLNTTTNNTVLPCQTMITRTWLATDLCGNTNICSQTVTEMDTLPPVFSCPTNKTVNCHDAWTFDEPAVTDNCSGTNVTLSIFSTVETNDGCAQIITRTWQAADGCKNIATCAQAVTVVNTNPPAIICPANILVTSCTATQIFYAPTATAGCDTNVTVFCTPPSSQVFLPGTTNTVLCVASNCAGTAKCSFTVTVSCSTNNCAGLVLECPQHIVVDCKDDFGAIVSFPPPKTASTCCPGPIEVVFSPAAGQFPIGVTPVICTARDSCGNTQQCTFNVVVQGHGPGKWTWANRAGGERVDSGNAVAVDREGNVLVTGSFTGEMNFPGTSITLSGFGDTDIFVAKYNRLGSLLWAARAGGRGPDAGYGIAVDQAGNVYVTGGFTGSASFGSVSLSAIGGRDIFIAKYNPNGVLLCATRDGDKGDDFGSAITVTEAGAVFLTGKWEVAGVAQAFVTKMGGERDCSISGTLISVDGSAVGRAIAPDASGDVYVTGGYTDKTSFGSQTVTAPTGFQRIFVAKFNGAPAAPTCAWAQSSSGPKASGQHDGTGIAVSGKDCFITGYFSGQADFAGMASVSNTKIGGVYDYLIAKFDLQGTLAWTVKGGGPSADDEETRGIAVNQEGNPCVTGFLHPNAPGPFVNEGSSVLVASYSGVSGLLQWTRNAMDGPAGPTPNSPEDVGLGIVMDSSGCVHVTGAFTEDLGFLPAATLDSIPSEARDMFVAKMCQTCCNAVTDSRIKRIGHNQYLYEFCYQNSTSDVISYLFLVPDPAIGSCYNFTPDLIALGSGSAYGPVIPPGGTGCFTGEHGITIATKEGCEARICFYLSAHNDKFNVCCAVRQCLTLRNIAIGDPIDGGTFSLNTNILVHLVDSTVDSTNQITNVKFRLGDRIVATDFMAPFETVLQELTAGPYVLSAIATDNEGLVSESLPVTFTVNPASGVEAAVALTQNPDRTLTVSWQQGENWMLQEAVAVAGPWSISTSQTSPMKLTPGGTNKFYRLAKP
jgi:hypothetical protein